MADSGASRTLITPESSRILELDENLIREPVDVLYGGGELGHVSSNAKLGEIEAFVVPNLNENLISLCDFTTRGSNIILTSEGGLITNPFNDNKIKLSNEFGIWRIFLSDVINYSHRDQRQTETAFSFFFPRQSKLERYISLHERMCHQSPESIIKSLDGDKPAWIRAGITSQDVRQLSRKYSCVICTLSKRRNKSVNVNFHAPTGFNSGLNSRTAKPGEIISIDPVGPISPKSKNGFTLLWVVIDLATTYQWFFFSNNKRSSTVVEIIRNVIYDLKFYDKCLKIVRSDAEEIFNSSDVLSFLEEQGIKHQTSVPYEHYQNRVERAIQSDVRAISTLMHSQKWLSATYWEYAAKHFVRVSRYIPTVRSGKSTPSSLLGAGDLDLSVKFLFSFGDFVAVTIPSPNIKWKFDMKRDIGIYLGDADDTKRGVLILNPTTGAIDVRLDCIKLELTDSMLHSYYDARIRLSDCRPILEKVSDASINFDDDLVRKQIRDEELASASIPINASWDDLIVSEEHGVDSAMGDNSESISPATITIPKGKQQFRNLRHNPRAMFSTVPSVDYDLSFSFLRPKAYAYGAKITVGQALKSADASFWIDALNVELNQMISTGTLIPLSYSDIPSDATVINSTMVLRKKPDKYKARLCACGNELKGQISETYSPTIGALTYATVHQISIIDRMFVRIIDTVGAYLYQSYPENQPAIFIRVSSKILDALGIPEGTVYRLKKYIYGLPDSGLAYYRAYSSLLVRSGYSKSKSDPCLFIKLFGKERIYIWIHVDDTFVSATSEQLIDDLELVIKSQFEITVNTEVESYLGIHFDYLPNGDVKITQPLLLNSLLEEFSEELRAHRSREPLSAQRADSSRSNDVTPMEVNEYLHLEGALIYLTKSRPDIQTAVSFGATHSVNPTRGDFDELIHCLKYLQSTADIGLILKAGVPNRQLILKCYVDASYLTHPDSKSHQGYCLSFGDIGSFYSKSTKQKLVSTSSTQSEIRALQTLVVEIIFINELCKELGRPILLPAIIFEDNAAVIALSREMTSRAKRCKHFLMSINWIREQVVAGLIEIEKIASEDNKSDLLTKILTGVQFKSNASDILGIEADSSS